MVHIPDPFVSSSDRVARHGRIEVAYRESIPKLSIMSR